MDGEDVIGNSFHRRDQCHEQCHEPAEEARRAPGVARERMPPSTPIDEPGDHEAENDFRRKLPHGPCALAGVRMAAMSRGRGCDQRQQARHDPALARHALLRKALSPRCKNRGRHPGVTHCHAKRRPSSAASARFRRSRGSRDRWPEGRAGQAGRDRGLRRRWVRSAACRP